MELEPIVLRTILHSFPGLGPQVCDALEHRILCELKAVARTKQKIATLMEEQTALFEASAANKAEIRKVRDECTHPHVVYNKCQICDRDWND